MPIIPIAIQIFKTAFKYRKQIYAVVTAQDRAIKGAFVGTKVSKAAQWGWRTGAAAGGLVGSLNTNQADDSPGNGIQTTIPKQSTPSKSYKTRSRQTNQYNRRNFNRCNPNRYSGRSRSRY